MAGLEVIGGIASILQLASTVYKISKTLYEVGDALSSAPSDIRDLAHDLETFSQELNLLSALLDGKNDRYADKVYRLTAKIIGDCATICIKVDKVLRKLRTGTIWARVKWLYKEKEIKKLLSRLRDLKLTLMRTLHMLHMLKTDGIVSRLEGHSASLLMDTTDQGLSKETLDVVEQTRRTLEQLTTDQGLVSQSIVAPETVSIASNESSAREKSVPKKSDDFTQLSSTNHFPAVNLMVHHPTSMASVQSFETFHSAVAFQGDHASEPPDTPSVDFNSSKSKMSAPIADESIEMDRNAIWRAEMAGSVRKRFGMTQADADSWAATLNPPLSAGEVQKVDAAQSVEEGEDDDYMCANPLIDSYDLSRALNEDSRVTQNLPAYTNVPGSPIPALAEHEQAVDLGVMSEDPLLPKTSSPHDKLVAELAAIEPEISGDPEYNESMAEMSLPFIGYTFKRFDTSNSQDTSIRHNPIATGSPAETELQVPPIQGEQDKLAAETIRRVIDVSSKQLSASSPKDTELKLPDCSDLDLDLALEDELPRRKHSQSIQQPKRQGKRPKGRKPRVVTKHSHMDRIGDNTEDENFMVLTPVQRRGISMRLSSNRKGKEDEVTQKSDADAQVNPVDKHIAKKRRVVFNNVLSGKHCLTVAVAKVIPTSQLPSTQQLTQLWWQAFSALQILNSQASSVLHQAWLQRCNDSGLTKDPECAQEAASRLAKSIDAAPLTLRTAAFPFLDQISSILTVVRDSLCFNVGAFVWTCFCVATEMLLLETNTLELSVKLDTLEKLAEIATLVARYNVLESMYLQWPGMSLEALYENSLIRLCTSVLAYLASLLVLQNSDPALSALETLYASIVSADTSCRSFTVTFLNHARKNELDEIVTDTDTTASEEY